MLSSMVKVPGIRGDLLNNHRRLIDVISPLSLRSITGFPEKVYRCINVIASNERRLVLVVSIF